MELSVSSSNSKIKKQSTKKKEEPTPKSESRKPDEKKAAVAAKRTVKVRVIALIVLCPKVRAVLRPTRPGTSSKKRPSLREGSRLQEL